jgi:hypothetical protein
MFVVDKILTMLILPTALMTECAIPPGSCPQLGRDQGQIGCEKIHSRDLSEHP